jgi:phosphatidylglycerol:prolipoprotein diacylglycerol transferase
MLPSAPLPLVGTVSTYAVVLGLYFASIAPVLAKLCAERGLDRRAVLGALLIGVPAGLVGSRILDVLEYPDRYRSVADLVGRNGSSIYGALILDLVCTAAYAWLLRVPLLKLLDAGAPLVALGEAASRIGCFLNGCCYGVDWNGPWAVRFPVGSFAFADELRRGIIPPDAVRTTPVHPVQLYSAIASTLMGVWLLRRLRRETPDGTTFAWVLLFYGALRLSMAPLRVEALGSMKAFSVVFLVVGTGALLSNGSVSASRQPIGARSQ